MAPVKLAPFVSTPCRRAQTPVSACHVVHRGSVPLCPLRSMRRSTTSRRGWPDAAPDADCVLPPPQWCRARAAAWLLLVRSTAHSAGQDWRLAHPITAHVAESPAPVRLPHAATPRPTAWWHEHEQAVPTQAVRAQL